MLTEPRLEHILSAIPRLTIGVLGDLFLDRYLDLDAALTEPSIETGLDAYQVTRVRSLPGAAGTVINNLVALGVQRVCPVSVIGDDGEGYELRQALTRLEVVDTARIVSAPDRRTPTYTKPMLHQTGRPPRELNRLDIKNRAPLPAPLVDLVLEGLADIWPRVDALLVLDQVSEADCGVVTAGVRDVLAEMGKASPERFILADSRERIGLFRGVSVKPNVHECQKALHGWGGWTEMPIPALVRAFTDRVQRPVFCTCGDLGMVLGTPLGGGARVASIRTYPVTGAIDVVGAGDSTSAAIACAVAAGASLEEAGAFGNLVASITIQQIGTTGTANPEQVRERWREISG